MKKVLAISSVLFGIVFLAGCSQQQSSQTQPTTSDPVAQQSTPSVSTQQSQQDNKREWVEISVFTQAYPEPWGDDSNIQHFFAQKGIEVYNVKIKNRTVCEALNCPSYKLKEVLISHRDKEKIGGILKEYKTNLDIK
jgi:hypothetical protein